MRVSLSLHYSASCAARARTSMALAREAEASEVSSLSPSSQSLLRTLDTTGQPAVDAVSVESLSPLNQRPREEDEGTRPVHDEAGNAVRVEATEEDSLVAGEGREHLTVSVHVQVDDGDGRTHVDQHPSSQRSNHDAGELAHVVGSQTSDRIVTSPARRTQFVRRPMGVQTTLTSSLLMPQVHPQLPNLALQALERLAQNSTDKDDSIDDFQPLKKRKLIPHSEETCEEVEEGQTCSICFEAWSNSGGHRIASLKCGHLFGLNCIEKWVKGQGGGKCPQCNAKAKKSDIRVIFAKTVTAIDTTERDRALMERDEEKRQRIATQKAEAQAVLQYQLARAECDRLKEQLKQVQLQLDTFVNQGIRSSDCASSSANTAGVCSINPDSTGDSKDVNARYVPCKTLQVAPNGGARVLGHDPSLNMLVVSLPFSNQLLPGYGLMKYDTLDMGHGQYVAAHNGVIRDVVFSPRGDGLVLTAGMDKTCRITSMHSNSNVLIYKTQTPVWACAWNVDDPNYLYAGLNGRICVYDVRNTAESVSSLQTEGEPVPITSLSYVPLCRVSTLNAGGLLAGTLNGGVFWQRATHEETFTAHPLTTIPGNCTCLSFEPATRHCMASFRPSKRQPGSPHSTHVLCQLCNVPQDKPFSCRPIHQFTGGTSHRLLSRSRLFQRPGNDSHILAAFGVEEKKSVHVWNASTMTKLQALSIPPGPALDITPFSSGDRDFLAVLSETTLSLFNWQQIA